MKKDPRIGEAKNLMRRKRIQLEHQREYDEAIVTLKQKVNGWCIWGSRYEKLSEP